MCVYDFICVCEWGSKIKDQNNTFRVIILLMRVKWFGPAGLIYCNVPTCTPIVDSCRPDSGSLVMAPPNACRKNVFGVVR